MRHATQVNRRHSVKPHYRHSAESDHAWAFIGTVFVTFVTGCLCGATIAMGVL